MRADVQYSTTSCYEGNSQRRLLGETIEAPSTVIVARLVRGIKRLQAVIS